MSHKMTTVWLVNPYGPIPSENWREYAYVILGNWHSSLGHNCIWWTSSYSHHFKYTRDLEAEFVTDLFQINFISTPGYKSNIGLRRILRDLVFYIRFAGVCILSSLGPNRPDCIVYTSSPLLPFLSPAIVARLLGIPVVFYEMDDWIGLLRTTVCKTNPIVKILAITFLAFFKSAKRIELRLVDGAFALSSNYLNSLLKLAPSLHSKPYALVYNSPSESNKYDDVSTTPVLLKLKLLKVKHDLVYAIYAGSMNPMYDIQVIVDSVPFIRATNSRLVILLAGLGPLSAILNSFQNIDDVIINRIFYMGSLSPSILAKVYQVSDIGICSYLRESNVDMPDKAYDYLSNSLPIVSSLRGELKQLIDSYSVGKNYHSSTPSSLAEALLDLSTTNETLLEHKKNATILAESLSQKHQRASYVHLIQRVLSLPTLSANLS